MKKGFTLIELMAVILIIGIIAFLTTPVISNIIKENEENALLQSANNYINEVNKSIMERVQDGNELADGTYTAGELNIKLKGNKPHSSSTITISEGEITDYYLIYTSSTATNTVDASDAKVVYKSDGKMVVGKYTE